MATTTATPLDLEPRQPGLGVAVLEALALAGVAGMIWLAAPAAHWKPWPLVVIGVFTIVSDLTAVESGSKLKVSGTSLGLMLAVVLLGAAPAALVGAVTIFVSWSCRSDRGPLHCLGSDVAIYAWMLLITG